VRDHLARESVFDAFDGDCSVADQLVLV